MSRKNIRLFIIGVTIFTFIISYLFYPRLNYEIISSDLKGSIVFKAGLNEKEFNVYSLNLETKEIDIYKGEYNQIGNIFTDKINYLDQHFYIKDNNLYKDGFLFKTTPQLTFFKKFKYFFGGQYLVVVDNKKERLGVFRFDLGRPTIKILNLQDGNIEQFNFVDRNNINYQIIDILGTK